MNLMKENRPLWERLTFGFAIGFGAMVLFGSVGPMIDAVAHALRTEYAPTVQPVVEHEIALVFIGSPECAYSTSADVEAAVRRLKREIQETAQEEGIPFRMVGISVNGDPLEGLRFLRAFGQFDEVAAGGFYGNASAQRFIFGDTPGVAATPQLVLVERRASSNGPPGSFNEAVLARVAGGPNLVDAAVEGVILEKASGGARSGS